MVFDGARSARLGVKPEEGAIVRIRGSRRSVGVAAISLIVVTAAVLVAAGRAPAHGAAATARTLATFTTPGARIWTVPAGVTKVTFSVYGASGGEVADGQTLIAVGGAGGVAKGTFTVTPGERFYVIVGGHGNPNNGSQGGVFQPNGRGGAGASDTTGTLLGGGGGGGASSVATGYVGKDCFMIQPCSDGDRFIVAGGGGGAGSLAGYTGGAAGGLEGVPGGGFSGNGEAGTQYRGGFGNGDGTGYGQFASGGNGVPGMLSEGAESGGGGGGFYGGGAEYGAGGGGGSSHVSGFAIKGSLPTVAHGGDGKVIITTP